MLLYNAESISKSFGSKTLFKKISLSIFSKDRIGLIGENGSGKSTLLKILADVEKADEGILSPRKGLKIGYLPQDCEFPDLPPIQVMLNALESVSDIPDYEKEQNAKMWLSKLGFTGTESSSATLSGGWKKRLALAKEMLLSPDLLLLDEPTNHLDLEGIIFLEKFLKQEAPTYLLVSHDRYFLEHTTNRIVEIAHSYPLGLFAVEGSYSHFLTIKESFLQGQLEQERSLSSKARREIEWLRTSPKARTTKSTARIDQAHELLEDLSEVRRRNQQKRAAIDFTSSQRETKKLLTAKNLTKQINHKPLFQGLDFTLSIGTRMALMGPNGSGKTTLLRLLASEILPDQGTIKTADDLKIVYFDQHRNQLNHEMTLREALSPNGDFVKYRGQSIHVNGWCQRFLFSPDHLDRPLKTLSGGERARIHIAHLMLQPADILLLDEPTNDLDIPTLETLEASLIDFPGAIVLITHDRCMLERICNLFLALGSTSGNQLYAEYAQWEAAIKKQNTPSAKEKETKPQNPTKPKLSYLEKKEYEQIEAKIAKLEKQLQEFTQILESSETAQNPKLLSEICTAISLVENQIEQTYLRWEELDNKK